MFLPFKIGVAVLEHKADFSPCKLIAVQVHQRCPLYIGGAEEVDKVS